MKANKDKIKKYINVAKGQLDGISKMIEADEYCISVSNQILASIAILKKANDEIITAHIASCVRNANGEEFDQKMDEISKLLKRLN